MKNLIVYLERVDDTPNVAIISTGDELKQINDVNSLTLSAIVKQSGCSPFFIGTVSDDSGDIKKKLGEAHQPVTSLGVGFCSEVWLAFPQVGFAPTGEYEFISARL